MTDAQRSEVALQAKDAIRETEGEGLSEFASVAAAEAIIAGAFATVAPWGGLESILLVEDEPFVSKVTAEVLESAGYSVLIAGSGAEAKTACKGFSRPIDLLLADIVMPGMSGQELAAEFHGWCPQGRVLLISGYADRLAGCELSVYGRSYLAKPFSMESLLKRVREVLNTTPLGWGAPA